MNQWMNKWLSEWIDNRTYEQMNKQKSELMIKLLENFSKN